MQGNRGRAGADGRPGPPGPPGLSGGVGGGDPSIVLGRYPVCASLTVSCCLSFCLVLFNSLSLPFSLLRPPRWPSGKASTSRAEGPGFESRLRQDFFRVESYQ